MMQAILEQKTTTEQETALTQGTTLRRERYGMICARHEMPVDKYWLAKVDDPLDYEWLREQAFAFCQKRKAENVHVDLFVTGLSTALSAFIEAAFATRMSFSLWHWKPKAHLYYEQRILAPWVYQDFEDLDTESKEIVDQAVCRGCLDPHDMKPYVDEEWLGAFSRTQDLEQFLDTTPVRLARGTMEKKNDYWKEAVTDQVLEAASADSRAGATATTDGFQKNCDSTRTTCIEKPRKPTPSPSGGTPRSFSFARIIHRRIRPADLLRSRSLSSKGPYVRL